MHRQCRTIYSDTPSLLGLTAMLYNKTDTPFPYKYYVTFKWPLNVFFLSSTLITRSGSFKFSRCIFCFLWLVKKKTGYKIHEVHQVNLFLVFLAAFWKFVLLYLYFWGFYVLFVNNWQLDVCRGSSILFLVLTYTFIFLNQEFTFGFHEKLKCNFDFTFDFTLLGPFYLTYYLLPWNLGVTIGSLPHGYPTSEIRWTNLRYPTFSISSSFLTLVLA